MIVLTRALGPRNNKQSAWIPWSANFMQFLFVVVLVGGEADGENSMTNSQKRGICLVVGSEAKIIGREMRERCIVGRQGTIVGGETNITGIERGERMIGFWKSVSHTRHNIFVC